MDTKYDVTNMARDPRKLLELIQMVIQKIESRVDCPRMREKEVQFKEILKTISRLEKKGVAVPDTFRSEKIRLASEIDLKSQKEQSLIRLHDGLEEVLKDLRKRIGRSENKSSTPKSRKKRSRLPKTNSDTLRACIINALQKFGGRARLSNIFQDIELQLKDQFLPADLNKVQNGKQTVWKNNVQWERLRMVKEGILKNDSPNGIWELSEDHS